VEAERRGLPGVRAVRPRAWTPILDAKSSIIALLKAGMSFGLRLLVQLRSV
jgi:hypothetical protein